MHSFDLLLILNSSTQFRFDLGYLSGKRTWIIVGINVLKLEAFKAYWSLSWHFWHFWCAQLLLGHFCSLSQEMDIFQKISSIISEFLNQKFEKKLFLQTEVCQTNYECFLFPKFFSCNTYLFSPFWQLCIEHCGKITK